MKYERGSKTLFGATLLLAAALSQASTGGNADSAASSSLAVAALESPAHAGTHRANASPDLALKSHRESLRAAPPALTSVIYPSAQGAVVPNGARGGELKGWVLLLMGAFLIATISQRRYQALSDL